jgi:glucokinase
VGGGQRQVGIDVGGTAVKAGCITTEGDVVRETSIDPEFARGREHAFDAIAALFGELGGGDKLGIGVPGLLDRKRGHLLSAPNIPGFTDVSIKNEIARRVGLAPERVLVENDANAAAVGEMWLGAGRGERDALVVTLGTGIGGGVILNGELYAGADLGGEVGHIVIDPRGPVCGCGNRGCVEQYASATAARKRAIAAGLPKSEPGDLIALAERARTGHAAEAALMREIGRDLGRGLGAVVGILDLRLFIFGGGFSAALDVLDAGVREGIDERCYGRRAAKIRLERAELGPAAGWIGAARVAMSAR